MPAPVPESVLKKRKTQEKLASDKAAAAVAAKKANKDKRVQAYKSAEKYVKEYRALAKQRVRMHRQAKAAGNHFVDGEAKLAFVVRIRGLNDMHPKTKKILGCMSLRPRMRTTNASLASPSTKWLPAALAWRCMRTRCLAKARYSLTYFSADLYAWTRLSLLAFLAATAAAALSEASFSCVLRFLRTDSGTGAGM